MTNYKRYPHQDDHNDFQRFRLRMRSQNKVVDQVKKAVEFALESKYRDSNYMVY